MEEATINGVRSHTARGAQRPEPQRVAILGTLPPLRGLSSYCLELALSMAALTEVEFISFKKLYPEAIYPGGALKEDHSFPSAGHPGLKTGRRLTWYNPLTWLREGFRGRCALLHAQWWSLFLFPVYFVICSTFKLRRKPVVFTVHNTLPHEKSFLYRKLSRLLFLTGNHFVVHTSSNKTQMTADYGIPPEKVSVIPHGTLDFHVKPHVDRKALREEMGFDAGHKVILLFGAVRPYKGYKTALHAFATLIAKRPECRLIVAGKLWESWGPYRELIQRLKIKEFVTTFLEYIPAGEVYRFFSVADLVILPYHHFDGQSGVGSTAVSFRKPLIVSRVGGLPDLVCDPRCVVPPQDPSALADALDGCLQNPDRLEGMVNDAGRVAHELSWAAIAEKTFAVYQDVLDASRHACGVSS